MESNITNHNDNDEVLLHTDSNQLAAEKLPEFDDHESVSVFEDKTTGLKGFIAIHNTNLGPAAGGTRYWEYSSTEAALRDVLNLSRAMTYKCALAGVSYGGGKGVIIAHSRYQKTEDLLKAYTREVNRLNGQFYTGEDVGIDEDDVRILSQYSNFIIGRPGIGGDPSPWAALGVFYAMQAGLNFVFGSPNVEQHTFAIKGLGKVGRELCRLLYESGGKIIVADINPEVVQLVHESFPGVQIADPSEIHRQKVQVYSPCALGGEFTDQTISELQCKIICGGANNQLASRRMGDLLHEKEIVYIPDYIANAGGLINVVSELDQEGYNREEVVDKVKQIRITTKAILEAAQKDRIPVSRVADEFAQEIFSKKKIFSEIMRERNHLCKA